MTYLLLFWEFFKTGLFAIGGGLATLPFLFDMVGRYDWFTEAELSNMIAVGESTPGPIGINVATYAGISAGGILGGLVATFAVILPSVIVILLIASLLRHFQKNYYFPSAMRLLRPTSVGLIAAACVTVVRTALFPEAGFQLLPLALFAVLISASYLLPKLHPILLILVGAAAGILLQL